MVTIIKKKENDFYSEEVGDWIHAIRGKEGENLSALEMYLA